MREWYVLQSKPRQEQLAASVLLQAGIETYLPTLAVQRGHGQSPRREPFFPGYLFGHLDPEQSEIRKATYTPGVITVVGYGQEPWPVSETVVDYIRQRLSRGNSRSPVDRFRPGERLVIVSGPLRGIEAVFDRHLSGAGRVRVLIQVLATLCPAEVQIDQLRRTT